MKKITPNIVFLIFFCAFFVCGELNAQVTPGDPPPPPPGTPIDGGLILLFISGVVLGVSKIQGRKD